MLRTCSACCSTESTVHLFTDVGFAHFLDVVILPIRIELGRVILRSTLRAICRFIRHLVSPVVKEHFEIGTTLHVRTFPVEIPLVIRGQVDRNLHALTYPLASSRYVIRTTYAGSIPSGCQVEFPNDFGMSGKTVVIF
jgi:hypothetical protein